MLSSGICSLRTCCLRRPSSPLEPLIQACHLRFTVVRRQRRRQFFTTRCFISGSDAKQKVIVISGPTGAGKSRLALELAKRLDGEIISADSVQVYRGLDVGSAKPSVGSRKEVPHHLIDILQPSEEYSVGQFFEDARQATKDILSSGRVPIVTGGTGLYLRWYVYGKPDVPKASYEITSQVYSELADLQERGDWDAAVQLVVKAGDPKAQSLASNDWYRLRRSLEIIKSSGAPPSAFHIPYDSFRQKVDSSVEERSPEVNSSILLEEIKSNDLDYDFLCFFLSSPRLDLYRSIDLRCEDMLLGNDGILTEARWLLDTGLQPNSNSATRSIGYRQAMEYLLCCQEQGGRSSPDEFFAFLAKFQTASSSMPGQLLPNMQQFISWDHLKQLFSLRNFAKRQMTWFCNERIYQWLNASRPLDTVLKFITDAYHDKTGNTVVPVSLKMKKEMRSRREASELKSYCTKNRHFVRREDCSNILDWIRKMQ